MGDQGTWILMPHGSEVSWRYRTRGQREKQEPLPPKIGIVALCPESGMALSEDGAQFYLNESSFQPVVTRGPSYIPADPGWRKGLFWEHGDESGVTWAPVVAWQVSEFGVRAGVSTYSEFGIEPDFELRSDGDPVMYWHVGEGEERKAELETELRAMAHPTSPLPPPPPAAP